MTASIARLDRLLAVAYGVPVVHRGPGWSADADALWEQRAVLVVIRDRGFTVSDKRKVR